jgi:hypothetical protein
VRIQRSLLVIASVFFLAAAARAAGPKSVVIEDGRANPAKYYNERPKILEQSHDMASEGKTSLHFKTAEGAGRMLLTKYNWPARVDFTTIAASGSVQFSLWIDNPDHVRSKELGDRIEFCIGSRSNNKFAYWYIPSPQLQARFWNQITLRLRDGRPSLAGSMVNGVALDASKGGAVAGSDIDWAHTDYNRWSIPLSAGIEGYLDGVIATAKESGATKPVAFVDHELTPMVGCPDPATDRITPPDVSKEAFFEHPDIDFSKIKSWTAKFEGGTGQFYLSKQQAIRGLPNARLEMRADAPLSRIILTPPKPVVIDHPFDTVEAWVYGAYHEGMALKVNFHEPSGKTFSISGGDQEYEPGGMIFTNWQLYRKRNPERRVSPAGTQLTSIEIGPFNAGNFLFTLDELQLTKFDLSGKPAPQFPDAGPEVKIPVTSDGACPVTRSDVMSNVQERDGKYILQYTPGDGSPSVRYILNPKTGTMGDLSVEIVGQGTFRPAADSGPVVLEGQKTLDIVHDSSAPRRCLSKKIDGDTVIVSWAYGPADGQTLITYRYHLMGKTLAVDASSKTPTVSRWLYGHADGLAHPKVIESPYRKNDANFLFDRGMFIAYQPDWYFSNVSTLPYVGVNRIEGNKAWYNWSDESGAYGYLPRTDGSRWPFKERFYISVSNHYDEILPTVNNPPSPLKDILKKYVWLMTQDGGDKLPLIRQYAQQCIDLGMTNTYFMLHAELWSNRGGRGPEPFIGRMKVSEKFDSQGGTDAVIAFFADLRKHGFRTGYYEGYLFMEPIAAYFHRDWLSYDSNGDWEPIWVQAYRPKPQAFAEYCATTSKTRQQKFGADVTYMDGWTSQLPFESNDYDARYPDSGKMITTIEDVARGFASLRKVYNGPAFSEGRGNHYRLDGLVDGNYGQTYNPDRKIPTPLFVDFQLLKTHTLGGDLGMGSCSYMFTDKAHPDTQDYYDFVASEIAFGNIGLQEPYAYLSLDPKIFHASILTYFMIQQLQEQYVMEPVDQIRYFDGQKLIDTDQAVASDVQLQSRVYVRYKNGLEIWANCNPEGKTWSVECDGRMYILPKGGWLAKGKDLLEFSATVDGRRVDYSAGRNYTYVDPGDKAFKWEDQTYPGGEVSILHKQGPLAGKMLHWSEKSQGN